MNLNPQCPASLDDQLIHCYAEQINRHDSYTMAARRHLDDVSRGGQVCGCEDDEDEAANPDHECNTNLLTVEESARQAEILMGLAQAAATAAMAAATTMAAKPRDPRS